MGLITYTNLEDATDADANDINSRFGAVIDQVNGNLDSTNLANGAVTTAKLADGSVTSAKLETSNTIDDNGWLVSDLGGVKTYSYTVTATGTYTDFNGQVGLQVGAGDRVTVKGSVPTPVGLEVTDLRPIITYMGAYSGLMVAGLEGSGSNFSVQVGNNYNPAALACTGKFFIQATLAS